MANICIEAVGLTWSQRSNIKNIDVLTLIFSGWKQITVGLMIVFTFVPYLTSFQFCYKSLGWVKSFSTFWLSEAHCWCHESEEPNWNVRCQVRLILSVCYPLDLIQWFLANLTGNPSVISLTILLVYRHQLCLHILQNRYFWLFFCNFIAQFKHGKKKFPD